MPARTPAKKTAAAKTPANKRTAATRAARPGPYAGKSPAGAADGARRNGSVVATLVGLPGAGETIVELPVGQVRPDPRNVRGDLGDLGELTKSIAEKGVLSPIVVTVDGDGWMVVFGHRRLAASKAAKRKTIPGIVRELTAADRLEEQLIENLHRADLSPIEEADAYRRLVDELGVSQRTLEKRVSRSQAHISKRLKLLALPERIQAKVASKELPIGDALELTRLTDLPDAKQWISAAEARARSFGGMRAAVDETLRKSEHAEARKRSIAQLEADKVTVVDYRQYGYDNRYTPIGKGWNELDVARTRCKTDGTLAAAVRPDGTIQWVCTDAKRYLAAVDTKPGETAAQKRERVAAEQAKAAAGAARAARLGAAGSLVGALADWKFPNSDIGPILRLLARTVVEYCDNYAANEEVVLGLIGVDVAQLETEGADLYERMAAHARGGDVAMLQVAVALALESCDPHESTSWTKGRWVDDGDGARRELVEELDVDVVVTVETLERLTGYQPTGWELEQLGRTDTSNSAASTPANSRAKAS